MTRPSARRCFGRVILNELADLPLGPRHHLLALAQTRHELAVISGEAPKGALGHLSPRALALSKVPIDVGYELGHHHGC